MMAPKPKTGGSFVKADTQTLNGGFTGDSRVTGWSQNLNSSLPLAVLLNLSIIF